MYQLLWFQNKPENAYSKELESGLCKVLVLSDKIQDRNLEVNLLKLISRCWQVGQNYQT